MSTILDFNQHFHPSCDPEVVNLIKESFSLIKYSEFAALSLKQKAYESLYQLAGVREENPFLFTSSGEEAVNQVVFSTYLNITRKIGKNHFITSETEDASLILSHTRLKELGCVSIQVKPNENGQITSQIIQESITPRTALISLSLASAQTGVIQPIKEIAELCKNRGILLHLDINQALGHIPLDFHSLGAHFFTFDGSFIHGPMGTGGLFFKKDAPLSTFIVGGPEQGGLRGGAISLPLLAGLGKAAENRHHEMFWSGIESARFREIFEEKILQKIPSSVVYFKNQERLPHLSLIGLPLIHHDALLVWLEKKGLLANIGGHHLKPLCSLFESLKINPLDKFSGLSLSFSSAMDETVIKKAIDLIDEGVSHFQKFTTRLGFT